MSIKINIKKSINLKTIKNYVLFCDEEFRIYSLNKLLISKTSGEINKTINSNKIKNKNFLVFNLSPNQRIILIKLNNKY